MGLFHGRVGSRNQKDKDKGLKRSVDKGWKGMTKYSSLLKRLVNKGRSALKLYEEMKLSSLGRVEQKEKFEGKVRSSQTKRLQV